MKHLTKLFSILELTRSQPQYGYALSGISQDELSNLAEHHYLVTFFGWQLVRNLNISGADLNAEKVLEYCLVHDLGELFGGDISMPYAKLNPKARKLAKAFEAENQKFLFKFFGDQKNYLNKLGKEILDAKSDEAIVAKVADYVECTHYKFYVKSLLASDIPLITGKLKKIIRKLKDKVAKRELLAFLNSWSKEIGKQDPVQTLNSQK